MRHTAKVSVPLVIVGAALFAVVTTAHAEYPTKKIAGTYKYQEKGYSGTMKITVDGGKYAHVKMETHSLDKQRGCQMDDGVLFEEDAKGFPTSGRQDPDNEDSTFTIKFAGNTATINTLIVTVCGMKANGQFEGKWVKAK